MTGVPAPTARWTRDDEPLDDAENVFPETNSTFARISVIDATVKEAGTYKLTAENIVGEDEAEFTITVKGRGHFESLLWFWGNYLFCGLVFDYVSR